MTTRQHVLESYGLLDGFRLVGDPPSYVVFSLEGNRFGSHPSSPDETKALCVADNLDRFMGVEPDDRDHAQRLW